MGSQPVGKPGLTFLNTRHGLVLLRLFTRKLGEPGELWIPQPGSLRGGLKVCPSPLDRQVSLPWWAQQSLHPEARGEVRRGIPRGPRSSVGSAVLSLPPAEAGGRRDGWQQSVQIGGLILNCSKMSRGSGAPPGPTPENTKAWAGSHEKPAGPGPGGIMVE